MKWVTMVRFLYCSITYLCKVNLVIITHIIECTSILPPSLENAIADAKACLQILNTNSDSPLILKNLYRLARALYFNDAPIPEIQKVLDQMEGKESEEYNAKVAEIREQLDYYSNLPGKNEKYRPFLLRSKLQDPYVEYYNFGECIS